MNRTQLKDHAILKYDGLIKLMGIAQHEYASDADAFENFNKLAVDLDMNRKKVLWVYLKKHLDGILTYLNNPDRASREPISGRISDAIVYLVILDAMIMEESERDSDLAASQGVGPIMNNILKDITQRNRV